MEPDPFIPDKLIPDIKEGVIQFISQTYGENFAALNENQKTLLCRYLYTSIRIGDANKDGVNINLATQSYTAEFRNEAKHIGFNTYAEFIYCMENDENLPYNAKTFLKIFMENVSSGENLKKLINGTIIAKYNELGYIDFLSFSRMKGVEMPDDCAFIFSGNDGLFGYIPDCGCMPTNGKKYIPIMVLYDPNSHNGPVNEPNEGHTLKPELLSLYGFPNTEMSFTDKNKPFGDFTINGRVIPDFLFYTKAGNKLKNELITGKRGGKITTRRNNINTNNNTTRRKKNTTRRKKNTTRRKNNTRYGGANKDNKVSNKPQAKAVQAPTKFKTAPPEEIYKDILTIGKGWGDAGVSLYAKMLVKFRNYLLREWTCDYVVMLGCILLRVSCVLTTNDNTQTGHITKMMVYNPEPLSEVDLRKRFDDTKRAIIETYTKNIGDIDKVIEDGGLFKFTGVDGDVNDTGFLEHIKSIYVGKRTEINGIAYIDMASISNIKKYVPQPMFKLYKNGNQTGISFIRTKTHIDIADMENRQTYFPGGLYVYYKAQQAPEPMRLGGANVIPMDFSYPQQPEYKKQLAAPPARIEDEMDEDTPPLPPGVPSAVPPMIPIIEMGDEMDERLNISELITFPQLRKSIYNPKNREELEEDLYNKIQEMVSGMRLSDSSNEEFIRWFKTTQIVSPSRKSDDEYDGSVYDILSFFFYAYPGKYDYNAITEFLRVIINYKYNYYQLKPSDIPY